MPSDRDEKVDRPGKFPSNAGDVYPVYHVFQKAADFAGEASQELHNSDPLSVTALALKNADKKRILIANVKKHPQTVVVYGLDSAVTVTTFVPGDGKENAAGFQESTKISPEKASSSLLLKLPPQAILCVDSDAN